MSQTVNKNMSIGEVVMKWPETAGAFLEAGLFCFGCAAARYETIEQGARAHGIDPDKLIEALNEIIDEKDKNASK